MAATQLSVYQEAARLLGDARLNLITDDIEIRYALDDAWPGAVAFCLRQAPWRFALVTALLAAPGGPVLPGFFFTYTLPTNWLRTHAIYAASGTLKCPIDCRQQGTQIAATLDVGVYVDYISAIYADPALASHPWPEHFARVVAAYLAFSVAARVTQSAAEETRLAQLFASLLPEAIAIDAVAESPWLRFQLDGRFQRGAQNVAQMEHWRYALKTLPIAAPASTSLSGYAYAATLPNDWVCTQALYVPDKGRECPFDVREHEGQWSSNIAAFTARYTSATRAFDARLWPDLVMRAVLAYLEFEESGETIAPPGYAPPASKAGVSKAAIWQSALAAAKEQEAVDDDPWFQAQIEGRFLRAARAVATRGYWWFAVKRINFSLDDADPSPGIPGYPYRFAIPADWLKTRAIFVDYGGTECPFDVRTQGNFINTATPAFTFEYLSTDALVSTLWPESFAQAVLARIGLDESGEAEEAPRPQGSAPAPSMVQAKGAMWQEALKAALEYGSLDEHPWLRFQLDGRFLQGTRFVLEQGRWRFAVESAALVLDNNEDYLGDGHTSVSMGYRFAKPTDWLKTIWVYRTIGAVGSAGPGLTANYQDVEFRDEDGAIHANFDVLYMRYLSLSKGLDSTQWPGAFRDALLAWLEHLEARADPKATAVAAARFKFFKDQLSQAQGNDDGRDRQPQRRLSQIIQGRLGRYGAGSSFGQGWPF